MLAYHMYLYIAFNDMSKQSFSPFILSTVHCDTDRETKLSGAKNWFLFLCSSAKSFKVHSILINANCFSPDHLYVKYVTTFDLTKHDDGQVYLHPKEYKVEFEPKNVKAHLGNLFNGNTVLGELRTRERGHPTAELRRD
jgi:hypothetical protein